MARSEWTEEAEDDLADIAYYIAVKERRPLTARKNIEEIQSKAKHYARNPQLGQHHPDLPGESRYFRHKRWIAVYQERRYGLIVIRVIDSARDFQRLFPYCNE